MNKVKSFITSNLRNLKKNKIISIIFAIIIVFVLYEIYEIIILGWDGWIFKNGFREILVIKYDLKTGLPIEKEIHYRTLWDLLQLLVIPAALGFGGYYIKIKSDREIAVNNSLEQMKIAEQTISHQNSAESTKGFIIEYSEKMNDPLGKSNYLHKH